MGFTVEAYTASWIEILDVIIRAYTVKRRSLYGFVDWNLISCVHVLIRIVEAYTASWIEIFKFAPDELVLAVEAYTASWIEMKHLEM